MKEIKYTFWVAVDDVSGMKVVQTTGNSYELKVDAVLLLHTWG